MCSEISLLLVYIMIPISHNMIVEAFDLPNDKMTDAVYKINDLGLVMIVCFLIFNMGYLIMITI